MSINERTPIFVNGRVVGHVDMLWFIKSVSGKKHFLQSPRAIAFDIQSLEDAENAGAEQVFLIDKDTGNQYRASIQTIYEKGIKLNRGFGEQLALLMTDWEVTEPRGATQGRFEI